MSEKPNVLFFFTDDQRFDTIAALGNSQIKTPNLDAFVKQGAAFTRAHIPGGTSCAVCMPSRAMLHSGRTLFHIGREGQEIPADHAVMGECFRNAGYETFGTGKWHNGASSYARSFSAGDEIFFGGMGDHWNVPACRFDPSGRYEQQLPAAVNPALSNQIKFRTGDHVEAGKHSTDLFLDASVRFLEERASGNPFFMYVSLMAPHDPRTMPEKFLKMYDPEKIELPENFLPEHPIDTGALRIRDEILAEIPRKPDEIRRHIAEYYAMISHLDDAFGQLLDALRKKGELDNNIIVFAGDNGLALGQHGLMGKQDLYDHSIRVPLILAGPGIPKGARFDDMVYLLDIFPSLCDIAGISIPDSVEGVSFAPVLKGEKGVSRDLLYLAYCDSIRGITDGKHKLIEYFGGETQLFDLIADPLEMRDMSGEQSKAALLADMRSKLLAEADKWNDEAHPLGKEFWSKRDDIKATVRV